MTDAAPSATSVGRSRRFLTGDLPLMLALLALVILLWLPFGFAVPFWADGWPMNVTTDRGVVVLNDLRPFVYVATAFARQLSPNLFLNVNLLTAAFIFGKGVVFYALLKRLTGDQLLAFAAAALLIVIPVDNAIFNDATFAIHFSLLAYLTAVYALLAYWQSSRPAWLVLMGISLLVTTGIYETVYPLLLVTPLILLYDKPRMTRRFILVALAWYLVPLVMGLRFFLLATQYSGSAAYQSRLFDLSVGKLELLRTLLKTYQIHFYDGWVWDIGIRYPRHAAAAAGVALLSGWWASRQQVLLPRRRLLLLTLAGLAALGLGYLPYLFTLLRHDDNRTYFYSSTGAVLAITALALLLASLIPVRRLAGILFVALVALLVGRGTAVSLDRHQRQYDNGWRQVPVLRLVTAQAPAFAPGTFVLVIDESVGQVLKYTFTLSSFYFESALRVLYQNPDLQAALCYPGEAVVWGHFGERCQLQPEGLHLLWTVNGAATIPYEQIVAFRYHEDGTLTRLDSLAAYGVEAPVYAPERRIDPSATPAPRIAAMLGENP